MQHDEGTFQGWGGLNLYYQRWLPQQPVQAVVGIVHGLGGHSGLFKNVVQCLVPQGYGIYGLDLRGHGRSPGQRGYIGRWQEFREDVNHFLQLIQSHHPGVPCFIWGHSLGGVIALDYALHHGEKLQGVIVTAPALGPVGIPRLRMAIGRLLSWSWPRFSLTTGLSGIPGRATREIHLMRAHMVAAVEEMDRLAVRPVVHCSPPHDVSARTNDIGPGATQVKFDDVAVRGRPVG